MSDIKQRIAVTTKWAERFEQDLVKLEAKDIDAMSDQEKFFHRLQLLAYADQVKTLAEELGELLKDVSRPGSLKDEP